MATETKDKLVTLESLKAALENNTVSISWEMLTDKPFSTSQALKLVSNGTNPAPIAYNSDNVSLMSGQDICLALTPTPNYNDPSKFLWFIDYKFTMNKKELTIPTSNPYGLIIGKLDLSNDYEGTLGLNAMHCLTASFWNNSTKKEYPLTVTLNYASRGVFNIVVRSDTLETLPASPTNYIYLRGMLKQV